MLNDPLFFWVAVPAVILAGVSKGGFGSGASFAAAPMLALVVDPLVALAVLMPLLLLIDAAALPSYWRRWDRDASRVLILAGIPGAICGALFLRVAPADVLRVIIALVALGFVLWQVTGARHAGNPRLPKWVAVLAGSLAGFTTFVSHAGGPLLAVYLLGRGVSKMVYQATTVLVFGALNVVKVLGYAILGMLTAETLWVGLLLAPAAIFGTWLGVRAHRLVPERAFFGLTYILLVCAGAKLLWDAAT